MFAWVRKLVGLKRRHGHHLEVAARSACGPVRSENQDHYLVNCARSFFCVADGMGGGEGGAKASEIVCETLGRAISRRASLPDLLKRAAEAIRRANAGIREYAHAAGYRQMATTVTVMAVATGRKPFGVIGYVGDSRVYRFRAGGVEQLTHDHTLAGELSRRGSMRGLVADLGGRVGALSHVLTRAVGIENEVQTDWKRIDLDVGDAYLLCSDGVYDMVPDDELGRIFGAGGSADEIAARLEEKILAAGARDNYTLIVIKVGGYR